MIGFADALFKDRDISQTFSRIAVSMTESIWMSNSSRIVHGNALSDQTYVEVRWEWMAIPLIVLVFAIVLLIITIFVNSKQGTRIWKSSAVALLVHGMHGWSEQELAAMKSLEEMNYFAAGAKAKLGREGSSYYKFTRV
jgi:hypothetical protein